MATTSKIHRLSILCSVERHGYCSEGCDCSCHAEIRVKDTLTDLAYELWRASELFSVPEETEADRDARVLDVIRSAESAVNFEGYAPEDVALRLKGTLGRSYWSLRETLEDLELQWGFSSGEPSNQHASLAFSSGK